MAIRSNIFGKEYWNVLASATTETGEWGRKVIEVYMTWYTFFASSNVLALGWIFGTEISPDVKPMLRPICFLFTGLNVLGAISTAMVGISVGQLVKADGQAAILHGLIIWAAIANGIALIGFAFVWEICRRKLRIK